MGVDTKVIVSGVVFVFGVGLGFLSLVVFVFAFGLYVVAAVVFVFSFFLLGSSSMDCGAVRVIVIAAALCRLLGHRSFSFGRLN